MSKNIEDTIVTKADTETVLYKTPQELTADEVNQVHKNLKLEDIASKEQVEALYKSLTSNRALRFYCVEDVTIVLNGVSTTYPANSNVEVKFLETDEFEIIPTSDNSILALNAYPGALGTYYSWLEGVKQFSNILFDMNPEIVVLNHDDLNYDTFSGYKGKNKIHKNSQPLNEIKRLYVKIGKYHKKMHVCRGIVANFIGKSFETAIFSKRLYPWL